MEKMIPQNIEAECGVLGSVIIDPEALNKVIGFLGVDDFYRSAHQRVYEAILQLNSRGEMADYLTICDELESNGKLKDVGGAAYITSLWQRVPTSGNVESYGRLVRRYGIQRRLIQAASDIVAQAYENDALEDILEQAERRIFEISQQILLTTVSDIHMSVLMNQYMMLVNARYENRGSIVGIPSGYIDLDNLLGGFQGSDLYIFAARPGVGKTAFALNLAYNAGLRFKRKIGIFSLEMSKEQLAQRFVALDSNVEQQRLRTGRIEDEDWESITSTMIRLSGVDIWVDDQSGIPLLELRSRARRWRMEYGIEMIIVDYLQLVDTTDERKRDNREQEVSRISRGLKNLARELKIPVLALAQLSRAVEQRQVKVPQLSDLRESGSIEQEADVVMFLYRDEVYNPETERKNIADIIVAKQRNGPQGTISLYFNPTLSRFANLEVVYEDDKDEDDVIVIDDGGEERDTE